MEIFEKRRSFESYIEYKLGNGGYWEMNSWVYVLEGG